MLIDAVCAVCGRAFVCVSYRSTAATAAGGFAAERRRLLQISINSCGRHALGVGAQQQMRVASCWEPTEKAQHRLFRFIWGCNFVFFCHTCDEIAVCLFAVSIAMISQYLHWPLGWVEGLFASSLPPVGTSVVVRSLDTAVTSCRRTCSVRSQLLSSLYCRVTS